MPRPTRPTPPDLLDVVAAADAAHGIFRPGEPVVVAVSGGPDSVALLHALHRYAPTRHLQLHAAHLDHRLRPDSAEDAAFVKTLAAELGIPCTLHHAPVAELAACSGRGIEGTARRVRYAWLARVAGEAGAQVVAVGHQADDQVETVLHNLLRGTGLDGLRGMAHVARWPLTWEEMTREKMSRLDARYEDAIKAPAHDEAPTSLRLVRPLLGATRGDILAYLAVHAVQAREDPSNADPRFLRNRLRHEVLPILETVNPQVRAALRQLASSVGEDVDFLEAATTAAWEVVVRCEREGAVDDSDHPGGQLHITFDRSAFAALLPALQHRLLRRAVGVLGGSHREWGRAHVERAAALLAEGSGSRGGSRWTFPGGVWLTREGGTGTLSAAAPAQATIAIDRPAVESGGSTH